MKRWHPLPAEVYALVERTPATVLLETAGPATESDACSRLFIAPLRVCTAQDLSELPALFLEIQAAVAEGLSAAGFFTYECGNFFEPVANLRPNPPSQPLAWFGIYDRAWLFDHRSGAFIDGTPPDLAGCPLPRQPVSAPSIEASLGICQQAYAQRIAAIHEWIRSGDVYQLNFTAPMQIQNLPAPSALYEFLRSRQPVEYGAFLHWLPTRRILSFSPELFFRLEQNGPSRTIVTRPMKGTGPRGRTTQEDRTLASWLQNDPKNRSENVMIVDLLRNDLGRICNFGSVRASNLFAVERHPTLFQLTSTVTGELRPEVDFQQIFRALFPCGSVTGAPKVRAMQLLADLETHPRGVYTGAIGFFSPQQSVFNVAIRTLDLDGQSGVMGVGSGIVIDSDPAAEFEECLLKSQFLTRPSSPSQERFSLIETLLWQGEFALIELHLDRLEDSAAYFGFPCGRAEVHAALLAQAGAFPSGQPRKVRMLLDRDGRLQIAAEPLPPSAPPLPLRVRIAPQRTDPQDRMLFHKTNCRRLYTEALLAASKQGFDDALFLNLHGEVTEGAIHNIFIEKAGRWFTPPVQCGLLAGVQRRHLLASRPDIEERTLSLPDLRQADAIYLSNAVRGLRPATIVWEAD